MLHVSLTAVQDFRSCEQLYYYKHVERLRRNDKQTAMQLGIMLHEYLEDYYSGVKAKKAPLTAHKHARARATRKNRMEARAAASEELVKALIELSEKSTRIADRYFETRGREDAETHEILLVEKSVEIPLFKGKALSRGKVDLVTRSEGNVFIWEHKSTSQPPSMGFRLRDLQTALYVRKLQQMGLTVTIDSVIWNYLRTKEPVEPDVLKKGDLSKRKDLDSTWEIYLAAIERQGLDPDDYQDQKERLDGRELSWFFPRYDQPILVNQDSLFRDYKRSVRDIQQARVQWKKGAREPVRNLGRNCDYCEMLSLCNAALLADDDSDVREMRYKKA